MSIGALGNVFQNVLGNGTVGQMFGGGGGVGGLVASGTEAIHKNEPIAKLSAKISANTTGGILDAEGMGDAAGIVADYYSGNWAGVVSGAKDLLENFEKFDIKKVGHNGLLNMIDPKGNLRKMLPMPPGAKMVDKLLFDSPLAKLAEGSVRMVGTLAKALPDLGDLGLGGGKGGKGGGLLNIADKLPGLESLFKLVGPLANEGGNLRNIMKSVQRV